VTKVDVQVVSRDRGVPADRVIRGWVEAAAARAGHAGAVEIAVRVVDRDEIRALNRRYRQQDKVTNVLSFPAGPIDGLPAGSRRPLGDVVVCAGVVAEEAKAQGKRLEDHWAHMLVHGTLHLMGFDHENDTDAAEMEALEVVILASGNVMDPYTA
jgi:probable rRNA maturation factor